MKNILKWIEKHKVFVVLMCIFLPMIIIHILFKIETNCNWIQAEWQAGDVLGYFGDVLAFAATVVLGVITLKLNDRAVAQNDKLVQMQHNQEKGVVIFDQEKELRFFTKNEDPILPHRLNKPGIDVNFDYIEDTLHSPDIMIMELQLKNITSNYVMGLEINRFELEIELADENKVFLNPLNGLNEEISVFMDGNEKKKIKFILSGLRSKLSEDVWNELQFEFVLHLEFVCKTIFNNKTCICFETHASISNEDKKKGELQYQICNFDYWELQE